PLVFFSDTTQVNVMTLRLRSMAGVQGSLTKIEDVLKKYNPGIPFEYIFVDDSFNKLFQTETLIGKLAAIFATLAILISCLGLFGLAAYTAERRTREIAIRKTLGAGIPRIAELLSRDFILLVALSFVVAFPVAGVAMHSWLQDFEYRTAIH